MKILGSFWNSIRHSLTSVLQQFFNIKQQFTLIVHLKNILSSLECLWQTLKSTDSIFNTSGDFAQKGISRWFQHPQSRHKEGIFPSWLWRLHYKNTKVWLQWLFHKQKTKTCTMKQSWIMSNKGVKKHLNLHVKRWCCLFLTAFHCNTCHVYLHVEWYGICHNNICIFTRSLLMTCHCTMIYVCLVSCLLLCFWVVVYIF